MTMPQRRGRTPGRALVVGVVALAGACGGGDGGEPTSGRAFAPAPERTTTTVATEVLASEQTTTSAPAPPTTATANRSLGGLVSGRATPTTTATTAPARPASGLTFTTPGVYRYVTTGTFTSTLGAAQPRDGETTLTVDQPSGPDQHSVRRGPGRTTDQVLRSERDGHYLVSLRTTDLSLSKEIRPTPPVLAMPADAEPGRTWSWRATSTDGKTTVESSFRAVRRDGVAVGTGRVDALVVEVTIVSSGDVTFTSRQTLWVSEGNRLVVRLEETTNGTLGGIVTFSSTSVDRLASLTPA